MWRRSAPIAAQRTTAHLSLRRAGRASHGLPAVFLLRLICGATVQRWEEEMAHRDYYAIRLAGVRDCCPTQTTSHLTRRFPWKGQGVATAGQRQISRSSSFFYRHRTDLT